MNYPFWDVPHIGSGWVIGLIAIFHMMIALFAVSIGVGRSTLTKGGAVGGRDSLRLLVAILELAAIATLVAGTLFDIGGESVPILADLFVVAFVVGLISWNIEIWRRLAFPLDASDREPPTS